MSIAKYETKDGDNCSNNRDQGRSLQVFRRFSVHYQICFFDAKSEMIWTKGDRHTGRSSSLLAEAAWTSIGQNIWF